MNIAVILAGGVGRRMGSDTPKQFIKILDKPIIIYTLECFENHSDIDAIEIVCLSSYIEEIESLVNMYSFKKVKWIVPGGSTFQDSVCNGVFNLKNKCKDDDILMIHMSVAPFVENDIITDSISVCQKYGNAISTNPCLLCMGMKTSENYSDEGILRETLIGLNTPQSFKFGEIYDAYKKAVDENFLDTLEPHTTSLMYELGKKLYFSKGSQYNIKITTSNDLDLFEGYVLLKQKKKLNGNYGESEIMINAKQFELLKLLNKLTINSVEELCSCIQKETYYEPICPLDEVQIVYKYLSNNGYVKEYKLTEKGLAEIAPCKVKNAFIFAAGSSEVSAKGVYSLPKGLYKVNGEVLIERQIKQLKEVGIKDIYVVVGYKKHTYFYLEEEYGIKLIVNPYPKKNNVYSLYAIAELIGNSYICNCDNYYSNNPFDLYERDSYHATVYKQDSSREIMIRKNSNGRITSLYTGNEGGECLYGHSFFNKEFSRGISSFVLSEINNFRIDSLFWEEFYEKHILDLDMFSRCYKENFLWEFDSIQEIQDIDNLFIENVSIQAIEKICGILNCNVEDVKDIEILSKGLSNVLFTFIVKGQKYIFRYPGGSTANIITSRKKEVVAQKIAAECHVDSTYVYIDETGCKLAKWVDNTINIRNIYYKDDSFMEELARKIRTFHDAGLSFKISEEFYYDPIKEGDRLLTMACETMGDLFVRFSYFRESIIKLFNYCEKDNIQKTICHNDINGDNCLLTDSSFDIIDYEFAGYNDPAFDFGRVIGDYNFDSESIDKILAAYFGRPATKVERRHWIAYVAIHDWYYFCWCLYKESINEDTREWMLYFYDRLKAVIPYVLPLFDNEG